MEKDIRNTKSHLKVSQIIEENSFLREEIAKLDEKNLILERQQEYFKRQLERIHEKYSELEREYDEQKDLLNEVTRKEKETSIALQKSIKEQQILFKRLETVELEALETANLKDKLRKITNERIESMKKNAKIVDKLEKKHDECESLLRLIKDLKEANDDLRNNYEVRENVIKMLRENNQQLEDENTELKLLRNMDTRTSIDSLCKMPHADGKSYCTIYDSPSNIFNQDSLYEELKASGFTNMCSWNDTISRELKKEVQWYELEIDKLIQKTESIFQEFLLGRSEKFINSKQNITDNSEKMNNLEVLRQRIEILLDTVNIKPPKASTEINIQEHSKFSPNGNNTNEKNERLQFMDHLSLPIILPATFKPIAIKRNRKSKSESNLLPEKKVLSSLSLNIIPLLAAEKVNKAIEIRKYLGSSTCEDIEKENKFPTESKETNVLEDLNSYEYRFGGTYRSLNNSTDSSVNSSSLRSESPLLEDFSSDRIEHHLYELQRSVQLAPMKLKLSLNKATTLSKEPCLTITDTKKNVNAPSNNTLIDNTQSEFNLQPKQYQIMEYIKEGCSTRDCNIVSRTNYLNDMNEEICSINDETYLIDKSTLNQYGNTLTYFRTFYNFDQENHKKTQVPIACSTPMRINSKNKSNLFEKIYKNDQNNINTESLIPQFANLKLSKTKIPIFSICKNHLKNIQIEDDRIETTDTGNKKNTLSISLSNFKNVSLTNRKDNTSKYSIITNIVQKNNTKGSINYATETKAKIVSISSDNKNQTSDRKENCQELIDFNDNTQFRKKPMKKKIKKNLLQEVSKFDCSKVPATKSNIQNDVISKKTELRNSLFKVLTNNLSPPSWRMLISYILLFLFGFYAASICLPMNINIESPYKWWSLEEILNRYFPIVNRRYPPPV